MKFIKIGNLKTHIEKLLERQIFPAISIYLKTYEQWRKNEKSKINFKNQLSDIADRLEKQGISRTDINTLLHPVEKLNDSEDFWKNTSKGTAFFVSKNFKAAVHLNKSVPSKSFIDNYFNVKHLAEYLFERLNYYILAISPKKNYLYEAEDREISLVPESDLLPEDMNSATWMNDGEKSVQYHSTISTSKGNRGQLNFHGQGASKSGKEVVTKRYLEELDNGIKRILDDYDTPMVLVCTDSIYSAYKEINSYPNLLSDYVGGNPDDIPERSSLLEKTRPIIKNVLNSKKRTLLNEYKDRRNIKLTNLVEIVRAAYFGTIDNLFIATKNEFWGKFNMSNSTIRIDKKRKKDSQDLVNLAIVFTIKNGGAVYRVSEESLGGNRIIGAMLRY